MRSVSLLLAMAAAAMFVSAENTFTGNRQSVNRSVSGSSIDRGKLKIVYSDEHDSESEEPIIKDVTVVKAGELAEALGDEARKIVSLTVRGPIDKSDFTTMWDASLYGCLESVDLEGAEVENNVIPANAFVDWEKQFQYFPDASFQFQSIKLKSIKLPDSVTEIQDRAFYYAARLTEIKLPASLKKIGFESMAQCEALACDPFVLPEGLEEIGENAFYGCYSLRGEIVLPESLKSIGAMSFVTCHMTKINFPENLHKIGEWAFLGCRYLQEVTITDCETELVSVSGSGGQFANNESLKKVALPEGLTTVPGACFTGARELSELYLPQTLTTIGEQAFRNCGKLKELYLPSSLREVKKEAFSGCESLETVVFPATTELIGLNSFDRCTGVKAYYCEATTPPECEMNTDVNCVVTPFGIIPTPDKFSTPLYVPVGTAELYRQSPSWYYFENIVETDRFPSASVEGVTADGRPADDTIYDLQGRRIERPAAGQIYIQGGRKMLAK